MGIIPYINIKQPLAGGWTNPFEKYANVKLDHYLQGSRWKCFKKTSCHHLVILSATSPSKAPQRHHFCFLAVVELPAFGSFRRKHFFGGSVGYLLNSFFLKKVSMVKYHIMQNMSKSSHAGILRAITLKRAPSSGEKMAFDWSLRVCFRLLKGRKEIVNSIQNGNNIE